MAKLLTLEEQGLGRQPPTVVILATTWWETAIAHVKLQACGLGVNPPVRVCKLGCYVVDILKKKKIACLRHQRLCCHANDHIADLVYTQKVHYYKGTIETTHKKYTKTPVLSLLHFS